LEDDWSFLVKIYALVETTCSRMLTEEFGKLEALDAFANVPMGTSKSGKLAFCKALGLLQRQDIFFIEQLGWLRNKFVHDVVNTQVPLGNFIAALNSDKKKELANALTGNLKNIVTDDVELASSEFFSMNPSAVIWISATRVLELMRVRLVMGKKRQEFLAKKLQEHLAENGPIVIRANEVELL
jgi:hypothetical protein